MDIMKELKKSNHNITQFNLEFVTGGSYTIDYMAWDLGREFGIWTTKFPIKWEEHKSRAGYIRNEKMVEYVIQDDDVAVLVAFYDSKDYILEHLIRLAENNSLIRYIVKLN